MLLKEGRCIISLSASVPSDTSIDRVKGALLTLLGVALLMSLAAPEVHELLMHCIQSAAVERADGIYQLQE